MPTVKTKCHIVNITETRWLGRFCVRCSARINNKTGFRDVRFEKWINARYVVADKKLVPGRWAPISFKDNALGLRLRDVFEHMF